MKEGRGTKERRKVGREESRKEERKEGKKEGSFLGKEGKLEKRKK